MDPGYVIRQYEPGDDEGIVNTLELAFNGWPKFDLSCTPLEHWRWKFLSCPIEPRMIVVAEKDDEIAGVSHSMPYMIHIGKEAVLGANGCDVATHPDHQKKGVYSRIRVFKEEKILEKGIVLTYGIETNPILIKKNLENGPDVLVPHEVVMYIRIRDLARANLGKQGAIKKTGYSLLKNFNIATNRSPKNITDFRIKSAEFFDERVNDLLERNKQVYRYIMVRDKEFLNWRYADPRGGDYRIWMAYDDEVLLGYIVAKINRYDEDNLLGCIMDLMVEPSRFDVADALMKVGLDYIDGQDVNRVYFIGVRGGSLEGILRGNGFVNSRRRVLWNYIDNSLVQEVGGVIRNMSNSEIYFSYGDIDWM
jgi:hypothetical protein